MNDCYRTNNIQWHFSLHWYLRGTSFYKFFLTTVTMSKLEEHKNIPFRSKEKQESIKCRLINKLPNLMIYLQISDEFNCLKQYRLVFFLVSCYPAPQSIQAYLFTPHWAHSGMNIGRENNNNNTYSLDCITMVFSKLITSRHASNENSNT